MQDILIQSKAQSVLDTITLGTLLRMIDSSGAKYHHSEDKTIEAKCILVNVIGCTTTGHTLSDAPQPSAILTAVLDSLPEKDATALQLRMLLQLVQMSKS